MAPLTNSWDNARTWWQTATPVTRAVATAALALLVIGLIVAAMLATSPDYVPIFRSVSGKDAAAIENVLRDKSIPIHYDDKDQSVSVPSKDESAATMYVEAAGILSKDAAIPGLDGLDKITMSTDSELEKVRILGTKQAEMERKLMGLEPVQSADVTLPPVNDSIWAGSEDSSSAHASVILALRPGESLDDDQVRGIVNLISHAVNNLDPKNIALTDQTGRSLIPDGPNSGPQMKQDDQYAEAERKRLQSLLDVAFPGKTKVTVQAALNFDQSQIHETAHLPSPGLTSSLPISTTEDTESLSGNAVTAPGGVAGTGSNLNAPSYTASGAGASPGNYKHSKTTSNYTDNIRDTVTQKAPGSVQKETVAALVDSSLTADVVAGIQKTLSGAIGATPGDSAHLVTVQQMPFDTSAEKQALAQVKTLQSQQLWTSVSRAAAVIVVAALLLFLLTRSGRRAATTPQFALTGEGANIGLLDRSADPSGIEEAMLEERPLRIEDVLAEMPDVMPSSRPRRRAHAPAIEEQRDLKLESVQEMINASPESVALLLKGWMYEEARVG